MIKSKNEIIEAFQQGDVPTGENFRDLIDSVAFADALPLPTVVLANEAEAEEGANNTKLMTPFRTSQSVVALARLNKLSGLRQDVIDLILSHTNGGEVPPVSLPACSRGVTITTFVKAAGNDYNVQFDAAGVTSIEWNIFNAANTNVLSGLSPSPLTSNTFTIRAVLPSGNYRIVFTPTNCSSPDVTLRTKTFTVASTTLGFGISDVTLERFPTKLKATIVMANPNNVSLEYSKDNTTWQSSLMFDNLTETNKFYAREVATPANKVEFTKQDSLNADWLQNEINDYEVVSPAKLNQVDLTFIPDFEIPKRNGRYVIENIFKGPNWRNQATAVNFFSKGFTHIDELMLNLGTERQDIPYSNTFVSTVPLGRIVSVGSGANYPRLELGVDSDADEMNSVDYAHYSDILNDYKSNVPQKFKGGDSTYKGAFIGFDLENGSFNLNIYDFVNRIVALHQALLDASSSDTEISLMYQSLPLQNVGFGVNRGHYNGTADATWTTPASMTANAQSKNFPAALVGKSLKNLSSRMRCKFEYYMLYEAMLPEGTRLLNKQNTNLTDWGGNDISILTHFNIGNPSYFHWAAHCAAGLGCQRPHLNGKLLMLQANHFNIGGNGYFYEQQYENGLPKPNQPATTVLKQAFDGLGRYSASNHIIQGHIFIAIFSGAIYYQWEANNLLTEEPRTRGEQINQYPNPSYRDYRGVGAQSIAFKRMAATKAKVGNQVVSICDLLDGNQKYLCENIEVDYLNVNNFVGKKSVNPLDWIQYKLSPVMAIVNEVKGMIAIYATQAYGVEQSEVDVYYTQNGYNFKQRITIVAGQNKLYIFSLNGTVGVPSPTPTPTPPPTTSSTIITEPSKPPYFFSDGHAPSYYDNNANLPRIITNAARPTPEDDYVWMKNDKIKVAINLKRGGQIAWASLLNSTTNLVYNGYDGGFQITIDAYQVKDGYTQNGKVSHQQPNNGGPLTSYNVTMGGDFNNHSQTLIDYKKVGDSYYVKFRPIFYVMDSEWSEIIIEVKYTLDGNSVRCEYKYYSFRTDGQYEQNTFDGAACPACFIINTLDRYQTYTGNSPWTNAPVEDGQLPIINQGGAVIGRHTKERWSCVYKANSNQAIGIYMPTTNSSEYSNMKQLEVYQGNEPGDEFTGGFTYFDMFTGFDNIVGNRGNYSKTIVANVIVAESPQKVREKVYQLAGI